MIEQRTFTLHELRASQSDKPGIAGHAAVFNSFSEDLGGFKEIIRPGAFSQSIKEDDIRSLWNHDPSKVLGRNKAGTLRLAEDEIGLAIENDFPDTTYARDVLRLIERGDVSQMSFGFRTVRDDWRVEGGLAVRELIQAQLFDVSPVTYPAYPDTDVARRALAESVAEIRGYYAKKIAEIVQKPAKIEEKPLPSDKLKERELFLERRRPLGPPTYKDAISRARIYEKTP